jgi:hypothetical protein
VATTVQQTSAQTAPYTVNPADANVVILDSDIAFTVLSGDHMFLIQGSRDTAILTSGVEKVDLAGDNNQLTTGSGDDTIHISGSSNTVDAGAGNNSIVDEGGGNTIVIPKAGQGFDDISGAVLQAGNMLDLRAALAGAGWDGQQSSLASLLHVASSGTDAILSVSASAGDAPVAKLQNTGTLSQDTLLAHSIV